MTVQLRVRNAPKGELTLRLVDGLLVVDVSASSPAMLKSAIITPRYLSLTPEGHQIHDDIELPDITAISNATGFRFKCSPSDLQSRATISVLGGTDGETVILTQQEKSSSIVDIRPLGPRTPKPGIRIPTGDPASTILDRVTNVFPEVSSPVVNSGALGNPATRIGAQIDLGRSIGGLTGRAFNPLAGRVHSFV
jgi:hypothetical protein